MIEGGACVATWHRYKLLQQAFVRTVNRIQIAYHINTVHENALLDPIWGIGVSWKDSAKMNRWHGGIATNPLSNEIPFTSYHTINCVVDPHRVGTTRRSCRHSVDVSVPWVRNANSALFALCAVPYNHSKTGQIIPWRISIHSTQN